jgi:hypothetical protein
VDKIAVDIGGTFGSRIGVNVELSTLVSNVVQAAIAIAGVAMLFLFVAGGLGIIAGAGKNDPQATAKGKQAVTYALYGFFVIFTSYWVIRIIEEITGVKFVTAPGI